MTAGDALTLRDLKPEQHFTEPPPRYTEATLVKALEENGIGRPSTYAPIMSTIQDRGYVEREQRQLKPTELGFVVNDFLNEQFPNVVDLRLHGRHGGGAGRDRLRRRVPGSRRCASSTTR